MLRIGHCQAVCHAGEFERNLATVCAGLAEAADRGVEILSFPESFLAGYWRDVDKCRANAWAVDSPQTRRLLAATREFPSMYIVGINERRGDDLYDTALVVERGELVGTYSKCWPAMPYFKASRETPVFQKNGVTFGVVICADGGFIDPCRILALKGARVIFAPHYNYIGAERLLDHYVVVRHDHVARAVENGVFFVRANNVEEGFQPSLELPGVGYGDSYILDPNGQVIAAANLHQPGIIQADLDFDRYYYAARERNRMAAGAFWEQLRDLTAAD